MNVTLSPWSTDDDEALAAAVRDSPDLAVQLGDEALGTPEAARSYIERYLGHDEGTITFAIRVDGTAVGHVALSHIERRHDTAWASYWVSASRRGHGLASRALATVAAYAFDTLGLFRLELGHRVNNPASCRVASAAGFSAEGIAAREAPVRQRPVPRRDARAAGVRPGTGARARPSSVREAVPVR